ncbi:MAG: sterol desaturase family protein [Myxococcota bacterium]|jgi:sterol desaturase/sphingolipid hydroxylase (fatty acid hydroxylase superfamily)|nr:sterol desaturase family protein [Myxococcota bacterium]
MTLLRRGIGVLLFPVVFCSALCGAGWALSTGAPKEVVLGVISAGTALLVAVFERVHPRFGDWNRSRGDIPTDALHAVVSMGAVPLLLEALMRAGLFALVLRVGSEAALFEWWPGHWGLVAQLALAMLVTQFGEYWGHRAMHEVPLLWRLHATHHSPDRLYWLNAARFHPLDAAASYSLGMAPALLLGAGADVLLLVSVWISVHGLFQHCNIDVRLGPLNYLFSMAELHRWHHSRVLDEANANYGNNILFWDLVFGTVYYPRDRTASADIGLSDMDSFPADYLGQVLSPLRWEALTGTGVEHPSA